MFKSLAAIGVSSFLTAAIIGSVAATPAAATPLSGAIPKMVTADTGLVTQVRDRNNPSLYNQGGRRQYRDYMDYRRHNPDRGHWGNRPYRRHWGQRKYRGYSGYWGSRPYRPYRGHALELTGWGLGWGGSYYGFWYSPNQYRNGPYYPYNQPAYRAQPRYYGRGLPPEHYEYCFRKYRSYRSQDNTFQPYNGPRRACRSPYWR